MSAVITSQELKGYQSQLAKAKADAEVLGAAAIAAQKKHSQALNEVAALEKKIKELQSASAEPIVSEHAMLRYLERVNGLSLDMVRNAILDAEAKRLISFMKSGRIQREGYALVVKNNTVVTVE